MRSDQLVASLPEEEQQYSGMWMISDIIQTISCLPAPSWLTVPLCAANSCSGSVTGNYSGLRRCN